MPFTTSSSRRQPFLQHAGPESFWRSRDLSTHGASQGGSAAAEIVRRHANLRAGFLHQDLEQPVQVIPRDVALPWQDHDLTLLAPELREAERMRLVLEDRARRFDPAQPPLLRFTLIRMAHDLHHLVLANHHILLDGWSMPILVEELFTLYRAGGDLAVLPRVTPYRDYLAWVSQRDQAVTRLAWQEHLAGLDEPTRLAPVQTTQAALPEVFAWNLPADTTTALTRQARHHGLTLNTVLQGAWAILIGHLTSRSDVVFGITVAGRPPELAGIERMVGLFINTVPLRLQLQPAETLVELLSRLQDQQSRLIDHQHLGLADIQHLAGLGELFDTLVVFENYPVQQRDHSPLTSGLHVVNAGGHGGDTSHYPLGLVAVPGQQLGLRLGYRPDLFDRAGVEAIAARLVRLLEAVAADPAQRVGQVELLEPAERRLILETWNNTAHPVPDATLPDLFEQQVARDPEATALVCQDESLTYGDLNARANQLAHLLIARGVGPESLVAIALPRSLEMVAALLAILKAGAAYLPLDPEYPAERLAAMLEDAQPACLVTDTGTGDLLPAHRTPRVHLDAPGTAALLAQQPGTNPADADRTQPLTPHNPAYVIYTSGSTGTPKGVVVTHRGIDQSCLLGLPAYSLSTSLLLLACSCTHLLHQFRSRYDRNLHGLVERRLPLHACKFYLIILPAEALSHA